jgi:hypothetical protein
LDKLLQDYVKERYQSANEILSVLLPQQTQATLKSLPITPKQRFSQRHPSTVPTSFFLTNNLSSAVGMDYRVLRDLLAKGNRKEADIKTRTILLQIANREQEGWIAGEHIKTFSCEDLRTIDQLWVQYSNGRFGFSVQRHIWQSLGGTEDTAYTIFGSFAERIGWRRFRRSGLQFSSYDSLNFTLGAPLGHLPFVFSILAGSPFGMASLVSRLENCNIQ